MTTSSIIIIILLPLAFSSVVVETCQEKDDLLFEEALIQSCQSGTEEVVIRWLGDFQVFWDRDNNL